MNILQIASLLIVLAATFGTINYMVFRLPSAIGILVVALLASLGVLALEFVYPASNVEETITSVVKGIEFSDALLEGMLGLLLFAGALHVKIADLRAEWPAVLLMATMGVGLSTAIAGFGFSWITGMPLLIALVFGALISPTDPVAVLGVLRDAKLDKRLETKIAGESLFNDGVGYVVYLVLIGLAFPMAGGGHGESHVAAEAGHLAAEVAQYNASPITDAAILFAQEALGGMALGLALGWLAWRIMRRIDDYSLEVLITLALAFGGYELAIWLHVSAPIMAVCAGLIIGEVSYRDAMTEQTRRYVDAFWKLIDEILNAVLFLLIGVELFAVTFETSFILSAIAALVLALVARFAAVAIPVLLLRPFHKMPDNVIPVMTWGGLKGGISIALALSLPDSEWKPMILTTTYVIVLFSIIVQGLTVAPFAKRLNKMST